MRLLKLNSWTLPLVALVVANIFFPAAAFRLAAAAPLDVSSPADVAQVKQQLSSSATALVHDLVARDGPQCPCCTSEHPGHCCPITQPTCCDACHGLTERAVRDVQALSQATPQQKSSHLNDEMAAPSRQEERVSGNDALWPRYDPVACGRCGLSLCTDCCSGCPPYLGQDVLKAQEAIKKTLPAPRLYTRAVEEGQDKTVLAQLRNLAEAHKHVISSSVKARTGSTSMHGGGAHLEAKATPQAAAPGLFPRDCACCRTPGQGYWSCCASNDKGCCNPCYPGCCEQDEFGHSDVKEVKSTTQAREEQSAHGPTARLSGLHVEAARSAKEEDKAPLHQREMPINIAV